jgi:hypothetical protein
LKIEAKEEIDIITCDIPNAFIQAFLYQRKTTENRVVMKITGVLIDMLADINPVPSVKQPSCGGGEPKEGSSIH